MDLDTDPAAIDWMDRRPAAEFSHGAVPILWPGETERELERETGSLADYQAGKEKTRVAEESDVMLYPFRIEVTDYMFRAEFFIEAGPESGNYGIMQNRELFPEITLGQFIFRVAKLYDRKNAAILERQRSEG